MIRIDNDSVFLRLPDESESRILHPSVLLENGATTLSVRLAIATLPLVAGQEILIYFDANREFMQQSALIEGLLEDDDGMVVGLEPFGKAVSAESRVCCRVSTIFANLKAGIGDEINCPLTDVSVSGFSVHAHTGHGNGSRIRVSLQYEGERFEGLAVVHSIRALDDGTTRYGMRCVDDRGSLAMGLKKIGITTQRQQLRRLAGG